MPDRVIAMVDGATLAAAAISPGAVAPCSRANIGVSVAKMEWRDSLSPVRALRRHGMPQVRGQRTSPG